MKLIAIILVVLAVASLALLWIAGPLRKQDADQALDNQADRDADHVEYPW